MVKNSHFVPENSKTWVPKRGCAQMSFGQKQPFCAGKLNLNHIKRSCAQMDYGKKIANLCQETRKFICARKPENSSYS